MDKKSILGAMALDLKRAAIGFHRGSDKMASRFLQEAIKRKNEYTRKDLKPYIVKIFNKVEKLHLFNKDKISEDALMYSTLIQNSVLNAS